MVFEDYTAELNARGLVVIRDCCIKTHCNTLLSELQEGFDIMMQLPGAMNEENSKRQFLKFPVSKCSIVPQEFSHRRDFTMCHSKNTNEMLKIIIADSPVGGVLKNILGKEAKLIEMNAIISEPG